MPPFVVVIPARYASTRLPAKPLLPIGGKPMVVRVAERAHASGAEEVWIATDHVDIAAAVERHGYRVCLTRADHPSGTDRIAEVAAARGWAAERIVVNVQGDEPLIDPALIRTAAQTLEADAGAAIATACHPVRDPAAVFNPNVVKVVLDRRGRALYFSRAPIPYARDAFREQPPVVPPETTVLRHVGIYAYRVAFLRQFAELAPAPLERTEALEQLRALWHGIGIAVATVGHAPAPGVDTPEDLERVRRQFDLAGK